MPGPTPGLDVLPGPTPGLDALPGPTPGLDSLPGPTPGLDVFNHGSDCSSAIFYIFDFLFKTKKVKKNH